MHRKKTAIFLKTYIGDLRFASRRKDTKHTSVVKGVKVSGNEEDTFDGRNSAPPGMYKTL